MARKVIVLQGDPLRDESKVAAAATTIFPGDLVEAAATAGEVQEHGTVDVNAEAVFALENPWIESAPGVLSIDTVYPAADSVLLARCKRGDKINARIAANETLSEGDALSSAGDGTLHALPTAAATPDTARESIVAYAAEDITIGGTIGRGAVRVA
jgi:hypothetical protein